MPRVLAAHRVEKGVATTVAVTEGIVRVTPRVGTLESQDLHPGDRLTNRARGDRLHHRERRGRVGRCKRARFRRLHGAGCGRFALRGTCPVAGTVEVYSDPADQGERYLGTVACDGVSPWALLVSAPSGRNVTAILTDTSSRSSGFSAPLSVP
jgi:hypothetical protein